MILVRVIVAWFLAETPHAAEAFSFVTSKQVCQSHVYLKRGFAFTKCQRKSPVFAKWDDLGDDDDDDDEVQYTPKVPVDMQYNPRNVMRQHENFVSIRGVAGKELTNDIYVREPKCSQFWFAGKVARVSDVSLEQAVARQWPLIEQHAANLRPIELFPKRGVLEIWTAPGDSELDVAYNRAAIVFQQHTRPASIDKTIKTNLVGYQGEIYERDERGFSALRTEDGRPLKPELKTGADITADNGPSDEDMEKIRKALDGKDINEVYEQQERLRKQDK